MAKRNKNPYSENPKKHRNGTKADTGSTKADTGSAKSDTVWSDMMSDTLAMVENYRNRPLWTLKDASQPQEQQVPIPNTAEDRNEVSFRTGDTLLDTYRIESGPFEGGMGAVWKVHHKFWDVDLALKRPKSDFFVSQKQKDDFVAECKNWIGLGLHPNIVSCYYVRDIENVPSIFSEWMNNGSVEEHIKNRTLYEGTDAQVHERLLHIAVQFARGLRYSHENGLIHQDVKPDNLLVTDKWTAKISDFGLARAKMMMNTADNIGGVRGSDPGATIVTPSGGKTPAYCSPEQAASLPLTKKTDIYSWAVSILEMYLGSKPWAHGRELTGPLAGIACRDYFQMCTERPVPAALQDLLGECLSQDPGKRPDSFAEIEAGLLQIYKTETGADYPIKDVKAAKETADSLNNYALSLFDLGENEEAEKLWKKALDKDPKHVDARYNLELYLARTDWQYDYRAVEALEAVQATRKAGVAEDIRNEWGMDEPCFVPVDSGRQISFRHGKELTAYVRGNEITFMWSELHSLYSRNDYIYYYFLKADLNKGVILKKIIIDQENDERYHGILMLPGGQDVIVLMKGGSVGIYSLLNEKFRIVRDMPLLEDIAANVRDPFRIYSFTCRYSPEQNLLFLYLENSSGDSVSGTLILDYPSLAVRKVLPDQYFDHIKPDGSTFFREKKEEGTDLYLLEEDFSLRHIRRFESGYYPIADPIDIRKRLSLRIYSHEYDGPYYLDDSFEEYALTDRVYKEMVCFDSGIHTLFLRAGAEEDDRVCLYDYKEKKVLCTKIMKGGSYVIPDLSNNRVLLWNEDRVGASWQFCAFPERPVRHSIAQWRLCRIKDTETLFSEDDKLSALIKECTDFYRKGNYAAALSRFRDCRKIPGFFDNEKILEIESMLDRKAKKSNLYAVKNIGEQEVPGYCNYIEPEMTVCEDTVLITSGKSNTVYLFSKDGKEKGKITSPHAEDRCFVRGNRIYALPSGLVFDLNGRIHHHADTSDIDGYKIYDVDLSGDNIICAAQDSDRKYCVRSLRTGEKRTLELCHRGCEPYFMCDGSLLIEKDRNIVRIDPNTGREMQRFAMNHGFHTQNESIREIISNSSRTHFAVIIADGVEFDRNVTMVFDENGFVCKWQGGNHCQMFADHFLIRCMYYTNLEFLDLRDGHVIHTELTTDGRQIAKIHFSWDYREMYVAKINFIDISYETYRLFYDYLL